MGGACGRSLFYLRNYKRRKKQPVSDTVNTEQFNSITRTETAQSCENVHLVFVGRIERNLTDLLVLLTITHHVTN